MRGAVLTEKVIDDLIQDIETTIDEVVAKTKEYEESKKLSGNGVGDDNIFWQDVTGSSSYFMANLSDYSHKIHKPYGEYLKALKMFNTNDKEEVEDDSDLDFDSLFD